MKLVIFLAWFGAAVVGWAVARTSAPAPALGVLERRFAEAERRLSEAEAIARDQRCLVLRGVERFQIDVYDAPHLGKHPIQKPRKGDEP